MTGRGRSLLAAGLVILTLGLVLGGVALALGLTVTAGGTTVGTADGTGDTTTATSAPVENGDDGPDTSTTTGATAPGQETTDTTGAPGGPGDTSAPGATDTTPSTMTPPTASPSELAARLAQAAASADFPVLGVPGTDWKLVSVDSGKSSHGPYVANSYERGSTYFSTSQERAASFPEVPNTVAVTVRGLQGDVLDLGHIVVVRWTEEGTNVIFSTNLPRADALAQVEALQPIR